MELGRLLLVLHPQVVDLALVLGDSHQQLGVGVLASEETGHNIVDIGVTSGGPDGLEGMLNILMLVHLLLHLLLHELTPEALYHERLLEGDLLLVLVVTGSQFSYLLLAGDPLFLVVEGELLVLDGSVET